MRPIGKIFISSAVALALLACGQERPKVIFEDTASSSEEVDTSVSDDLPEGESSYSSVEESGNQTVSVPFRLQDGIKYVPVRVNGYSFEMVFDTGCSTTLISLAEANYLYQKGVFTEEDIIGQSQSVLADGTIVPNVVVNLREVVVGDKIMCKDVRASVSANTQASLLLGNEVLDRVASYTIDNENQVINFNLK